MRKQKGFSLIELLIVVAIILIIAAIAIPNLMRSKQAANQAAAAGNTRTLIGAETTFSTTFPSAGYAGSLFQLGPGAAACAAPHPDTTNACMIDFVLGCAAGVSGAFCLKDNYNYAITQVGAAAPFTDFVIFASPQGATSGQTDYCSSSDGVVRFAKSAAAPPSPIIGTVAACTNAPFAPL